MTEKLVVGIDIGTSGARAVALRASGAVLAQASAKMADHGANFREPGTWLRTLDTALDGLFAEIDPKRVAALAADGTSGTMLPIDRLGLPLADALMYSDPVADADILAAIARVAPAETAAHGPTSGLAKAMMFRGELSPWKVIHQADWIAGMFSGRFEVSDENNALKTGYDPVARHWPDWIAATGADVSLLPKVVAPGTPVGHAVSEHAHRHGLSPQTLVVAGTTDGCASFLATGAENIGDGVTVLGTSLTVKVLSDEPIFAPRFGIYSHRIGDRWLAGGASNTGGKVLAHFFPDGRIAGLSNRIDPERSSGLDYYPLVGTGERFPVADPDLAPRLEPRPDDDARFLHGIFEGIAAIEALGYERMAELGGPRLKTLRSVGGGAANPAWAEIRRRKLGVPFLPALSEEAAVGAARLALRGALEAGALSR
ncbi:FGGY-family carbohydrate kinase [Mesorhizobium sp. LHD-90]|uniref:FGGY-family carbohydrate kinase n=1 Tax=Mesorhizobium sp. LHD-90 TaxID=3071414 RepID=UPI0027E1F9D1|nr:FGGY-family carbohydrate kinase [Mesorhizobium sp. LHD-90]MDQ6434834.1 FGGY-family carbohydrate kinase [Mesorhizobium sp. LHD-90]